jgi:hypothetical protein
LKFQKYLLAGEKKAGPQKKFMPANADKIRVFRTLKKYLKKFQKSC